MPQNLPRWSSNPPCPGTHHCETQTTSLFPRQAAELVPMISSSPGFLYLHSERICCSRHHELPQPEPVHSAWRTEAQGLPNLESLPNPNPPALRPKVRSRSRPSPKDGTALPNPSPGLLCPCPPWHKAGSRGVNTTSEKFMAEGSAQAGPSRASTTHHAGTWASIPGLSKCTGSSPGPVSGVSTLPSSCYPSAWSTPTTEAPSGCFTSEGTLEREGMRKESHRLVHSSFAVKAPEPAIQSAPLLTLQGPDTTPLFHSQGLRGEEGDSCRLMRPSLGRGCLSFPET